MTETPQPPDPQNAAPGYYPDGNGTQRYWDGNAWTEHTQAFGATPVPRGAAGSQEDRPWFKKKRFIIPLAVVALMMIGGIAGGDTEDGTDDIAVVAADDSSSDEPKADKTTEAPKPKPKAEPKPKANVVKVTADQMLKDYEENELAADKKYEGKRIQVNGTIDKIDTEVFGDDYVLRISNGDEYSFLTVNCNDMSKGELSTLTVGNKVTAVGGFDDGGDLGVELKKCKLA